MSQFGNLFNSTRIPELGKDRLKCNPNARHMLMMKNGHFYVFDIFDRDGRFMLYPCLKHVNPLMMGAPVLGHAQSQLVEGKIKVLEI